MSGQALLMVVTLGALIGCQEAEKSRSTPHTVNDDVPFLALGYTGYNAILDPKTRGLVEKQVFQRMMFAGETLDKGTLYFPKLTTRGNPKSVVTIKSAGQTMMLVTAITYDEHTHKAVFRHGLIPYREYEEYLNENRRSKPL